MIIEHISHLEHKFRPLAKTLLPKRFFVNLYSLSRAPYLKALSQFSKSMPEYQPTMFEQRLFKSNLLFRNDLGNAAGMDKDGSLLEFNYKMGAGYAIVGTSLSSQYAGNLISAFGKKVNPWVPLPNSSSAINSLGLPNQGIDQTVANISKFRSLYPQSAESFPICLSLMGNPAEKDASLKLSGLLDCIKKSYRFVDFFEINESCPNVGHSNSSEEFEERIKEIVKLRDSFDNYRPILLKLVATDNVLDSLESIISMGIDGISLSNTFKNYQELLGKIKLKDRDLFNYYTNHFAGGVSGEAIKDTTWQAITEINEYLNQNAEAGFLVNHVGGISSNADIQASRKLEKVKLRSWYTAYFDQMGLLKWKDIYPSMLR